MKFSSLMVCVLLITPSFLLSGCGGTFDDAPACAPIEAPWPVQWINSENCRCPCDPFEGENCSCYILSEDIYQTLSDDDMTQSFRYVRVVAPGGGVFEVNGLFMSGQDGIFSGGELAEVEAASAPASCGTYQNLLVSFSWHDGAGLLRSGDTLRLLRPDGCEAEEKALTLIVSESPEQTGVIAKRVGPDTYLIP